MKTIACLVLICAIAALRAETTTLSAAGLAEALSNPELADSTDAEVQSAARKRVLELLCNQPTERELPRVHERLTLLARHRQTGLGRLFFAALRGLPQLKDVPAQTREAAISATWPLAFGTALRARVGWRRDAEGWRVSEFHIEMTGTAAALFAGGAPYFGAGTPDALILDAEELDYLLGRDIADRARLASERSPFDLNAAIEGALDLEAGAPQNLLTRLRDGLKPGESVEQMTELLDSQLETRAERDALAKQAKNPAFWQTIRAQVEAVAAQALPMGAPKGHGARLEIRTLGPGGGEYTFRRLDDGRLVLRIVAIAEGNQGDAQSD